MASCLVFVIKVVFGEGKWCANYDSARCIKVEDIFVYTRPDSDPTKIENKIQSMVASWSSRTYIV